MNRAVYIGGFGNGTNGTERVVSALATKYDSVTSITFSRAMGNPDKTRRLTEGTFTVTHSAGMLALMASGACPEELAAFGPPLPLPLTQFPKRTILKRMRMHKADIGIQSPKDAAAIKEYEASSISELFRHPVGNFGHLGKISRFDAVEAAIAAKQNRDTDISLIYTDGDEYFQLPPERERVAEAAGISVMRFAGIHDELALRPTATLDQFYRHREGLE